MLNKIIRKYITRIIEENLDYLVRFAYYRLNDRAEAEDVVYEAVLRLLERDEKSLKPESIRLYLFRTVHNLCHDMMKIRHRMTASVETIDIEDDHDTVLDLEEAERINACLEELHVREAEIIRMHAVDGLSFVEISCILSIPQSTAKSRYKSGMDKLRKLFFNHNVS